MITCTLIIQTIVNLLACGVSETCSMNGNVKVCIPLHGCPAPKQTYQCTKPDGSKYLIDSEQLKEQIAKEQG